MNGFLSLDSEENTYAGWTKFVFGYCDGAFHQGYSKDPVKYKDTSLYFRGAAITRSHFDWIDSKYNLKSADNVIISGAAAGGIAVNIWSDYLKKYVKNSNSVYPISQSGVYVNLPAQLGDSGIAAKVENVFKVANGQEASPNAACNAAQKGTEWKCLFLDTLHPYITGKFMVINSDANAYDVAKPNFEKCLKRFANKKGSDSCYQGQVSYVDKYIDSYRNVLDTFSSINEQVSIWSKSCPPNVNSRQILYEDSPLEKLPPITGATPREAIDSFVQAGKVSVVYESNCWQTNEDFTQ